jgi:hypothetical protein
MMRRDPSRPDPHARFTARGVRHRTIRRGPHDRDQRARGPRLRGDRQPSPQPVCRVCWRVRRPNAPWRWAPMRGTGISRPRASSRSMSGWPPPGIEADLLYLDCDAVTLQRRYSETRRRHPLAPEDDPANGIARELDLLGPLRRRRLRADRHHDAVAARSAQGDGASFRARDGAKLPSPSRRFPTAAVCRPAPTWSSTAGFCATPIGSPTCDPRRSRPAVQRLYRGRSPFSRFATQVFEMLDLLLPAFRDSDRSHLTVAFGCTGGNTAPSP